MSGRWSSLLLLKSRTQARNISSSVWIVHSACPSVCGWKVVLRFTWVPKPCWNIFQTFAVNWVPQSEMIETGVPCSLTISLIYNWAYCSAVSVDLTGKKCDTFVSRSTIIQIESNLHGVHGNPTTKSILIIYHFHIGISIFCANHRAFGIRPSLAENSDILPQSPPHSSSYHSTNRLP